MRTLPTIVAACTIATAASAQGMRTRDVEHVCARDTVRCEARLLGEIDGIEAGQHFAHVRICVPERAGPQEKFRVVRHYMAKHPEAMSVNVGFMVAGALAEAYPCPRNKAERAAAHAAER